MPSSAQWTSSSTRTVPGAACSRSSSAAASAAGDDFVEPDVEQRPERPRRVQRVARAPQDATTVGEGADERGLADAGLAADQDQPAGRAVEDVEEGLALE